LSTSANTASLFPTWKQEVNRRVAAHMRSKTPPAGGTRAPSESRPVTTSRAAQAAARVAKRFAYAPSYNEVLTDEARTAVRAAKAASRAAQEAQAAVQYVPEGFEAASIDASGTEPAAEPVWEPQIQPDRIPERQTGLVMTPAPQNLPQPLQFHEAPLFSPRWKPDIPGQPAEPAPALATLLPHRRAIVEACAEDRWEPNSPFPANPGTDDVYTVEPAQLCQPHPVSARDGRHAQSASTAR
jgi:hypothetical protein